MSVGAFTISKGAETVRPYVKLIPEYEKMDPANDPIRGAYLSFSPLDVAPKLKGALTMSKTVRFHRYGGPEVLMLEDSQIGSPGRGEVHLVQAAIGVNYVDNMLRDGTFGVPLPSGIGFEAAGTIARLGDGVSGLKVGDRVGYFYADGAYCSERVISTKQLVPLPHDISFEQCAALLAKGLTAWMGLRVLSRINGGDKVVVLGASGSVGAIISRWAKAIGANVVGVAGTDSKLAKVAAGADIAVAASDPEALAKIFSMAPEGVDVVFDFVGRATEELAVQAVKTGGSIVTIGAASGQPRFDQSALASKSVRVQGGSTPQAVNGERLPLAAAELFSKIRSGLFDDLEIIRYLLTDVVTAHSHLSTRKMDGLPILVP